MAIATTAGPIAAFIAHESGCHTVREISSARAVIASMTYRNLTRFSHMDERHRDKRCREIEEGVDGASILVAALCDESAKPGTPTFEVERFALDLAADKKVPIAVIVTARKQLALLQALSRSTRPYLHLGVTKSAEIAELMTPLFPSDPYRNIWVRANLTLDAAEIGREIVRLAG